MHKTLKTLVGMTAVVAPIATGWVYTAGASVGDVGQGLLEVFQSESSDEWTVDGYRIGREELDGVVTMTITGPDGENVALEDAPPHIAEEAQFYESEWVVPESSVSFETADGRTCYVLLNDVSAGDDFAMTEGLGEPGEPEVIRAIRGSADSDGNVSVDAAEFALSDWSEANETGLHEGTLDLADVPGGTEIFPCDG